MRRDQEFAEGRGHSAHDAHGYAAPSSASDVAGETGRELVDAHPVNARRRQRTKQPAADGATTTGDGAPQANGEGAAVVTPAPGKSAPPLAEIHPAADVGAIPEQRMPQGNGESGASGEASPMDVAPPLAVTIARIGQLARQRRYATKQQTSVNNRLGGTVRGLLGWRSDLPEKEREAVRKRAAAVIAATESGKPTKEPPEVAAIVGDYVLVTRAACSGFDQMRESAEAELRKLARQLPVWPLPPAFKGFAELGLAVLIGEAGALYDPALHAEGRGYANPAKLWKRLGLGMVGGERQRKCTDAEKAREHGFSPRRRAEMHAFIGDVMLRAQWRGEKDGVAAHAIGPYGEVYAAWKAKYLAREGWTPKHADMAARRYMTKRVARDLWRLWRAASTGSKPAFETLPAAPSQATD